MLKDLETPRHTEGRGVLHCFLQVGSSRNTVRKEVPRCQQHQMTSSPALLR